MWISNTASEAKKNAFNTKKRNSQNSAFDKISYADNLRAGGVVV
jgi:hypothetical protein